MELTATPKTQTGLPSTADTRPLFGCCPSCNKPAEDALHLDGGIYGVCHSDEYYWFAGTGESAEKDETITTRNMLQVYKRVEGVL